MHLIIPYIVFIIMILFRLQGESYSQQEKGVKKYDKMVSQT